MHLRDGVGILLATGLVGCGADQLRKIPCVQAQSDFDIEEVSALEGVYLLPHGADAVILDANTAKVPADGVWRVGSVEVLVVVAQAQFASYPHDVELTVEVWDDDKPTAKPSYALRQTLDPAALTWTDVKLPDPDTNRSTAYRRAWWKFDFSKVIPETGMAARQYLVGARWTSDKRPLIGASKFNRPCAKNWSDYADGKGWVLNGRTSGSGCNWPMFKVGSEIITQRAKCD